MRNCPSLPDNHLWTLTDSPDSGAEIITVSDDGRELHLMAMPYPEDVYSDVIKQAESYRIVEDSVTKSGDGTERYRRESNIEPKCIVVEDDGFAGVYTLCERKVETHLHFVSSAYRDYSGILFADGSSAGINCNEFEGNPGCFRHTCTYSLEERLPCGSPDAENEGL